MLGYIVAQVKVHDSQEYKVYRVGFQDALRPFGGRVLVSTDEAEVFEGKWPDVRTVVMEFPSIDQAKEWYKSEKYQKLAQHRFKAATTNMILVNGFSP